MAVAFGFGALLIGTWTAPAATAKDMIYWANFGTQAISFTNLDGSAGFGNVNIMGATPGGPDGVTIDTTTGKIYWANDTANKISFANLNDSGGGDLSTTGATVSEPFGIAIDTAGGKIYWANFAANKISFANLNGTGGGDLNTGTATVSGPTGVAVDAAAGKIYWANFSGNKISFAFLNNSGGGDLNTTGATVTAPEGVAIDNNTGRVYWADQGANKISFANLSGIGGGDVPTGSATVATPSGVAIDPVAGKIYWANQNGGLDLVRKPERIGRREPEHHGDSLLNANGPALLETPSAAGTPTVTGGAVAPTTLSCSQGNWAGDVLRSFLYQAPASFSFSWLKNGSPIPGANTSSLTATSSGNYQCRVAATNFAGSTTQTSAGSRSQPRAPRTCR